MQKSLPDWPLCTHPGGAKLWNVGHKSLGIKSSQHPGPAVPSEAWLWPGVRDLFR